MTPRYSTSSRPMVMDPSPNISQWTCPPSKRASWNISAPGRLVMSMPKAMGSSSRGSNFFTIARYSSAKAMIIIMTTFTSPVAI